MRTAHPILSGESLPRDRSAPTLLNLHPELRNYVYDLLFTFMDPLIIVGDTDGAARLCCYTGDRNRSLIVEGQLNDQGLANNISKGYLYLTEQQRKSILLIYNAPQYLDWVSCAHVDNYITKPPLCSITTRTTPSSSQPTSSTIATRSMIYSESSSDQRLHG